MRRFGRRDAAPTFSEQIPRLDLAARRAIDSEAYSDRCERLCQRSGTCVKWTNGRRFDFPPRNIAAPKCVTMEHFATRARQSAGAREYVNERRIFADAGDVICTRAALHMNAPRI